VTAPSSASTSTSSSSESAARERRAYDSTLRRERAAQTGERILTAGAELVRESSIRDWRGVTIRAVAERAGVNERTVYRHFSNERALRDAVMQRLEQQSGIELEQLHVNDIADATQRIFRFVSSTPLDARPPLDPTLAEVNRRQHSALLAAVTEHTAHWSPADRTLAAAMFDVLWSVASYERLVADWGLDSDDAALAITWTIGLIAGAVRDGRPPSAASS
jgi:AcrR family transcriptional regulator